MEEFLKENTKNSEEAGDGIDMPHNLDALGDKQIDIEDFSLDPPQPNKDLPAETGPEQFPGVPDDPLTLPYFEDDWLGNGQLIGLGRSEHLPPPEVIEEL